MDVGQVSSSLASLVCDGGTNTNNSLRKVLLAQYWCGIVQEERGRGRGGISRSFHFTSTYHNNLCSVSQGTIWESGPVASYVYLHCTLVNYRDSLKMGAELLNNSEKRFCERSTSPYAVRWVLVAVLSLQICLLTYIHDLIV